MVEPSDRPQPEALLSELKKEKHGRLKIFLGAARASARPMRCWRRRSAATRREPTLLSGSSKPMGGRKPSCCWKGWWFCRASRSSIATACSPKWISTPSSSAAQAGDHRRAGHTNVPGSRHVKRYQDVEEILDAGIDVYTTLNIQHLESLNDIIARIARIRVRETVPDSVLDEADEIELIDLPPEDLIERLKQGKVYVKDQATRAMSHFFSRGNLTALRELTMRAAAERVDAEMLHYMKAHAISGPWPTRERVMVCVNESAVGSKLVRGAQRAPTACGRRGSRCMCRPRPRSI